MATVRDAEGKPLDGVAVHLIDTIEGLDTPLTVGRTQAGIVVFPPVLAPGDYRLRVVDRNQPVVNAPFTVQANVQTAVALTVPTSIPCVLRIAPPSRGGLQARPRRPRDRHSATLSLLAVHRGNYTPLRRQPLNERRPPRLHRLVQNRALRLPPDPLCLLTSHGGTGARTRQRLQTSWRGNPSPRPQPRGAGPTPDP